MQAFRNSSHAEVNAQYRRGDCILSVLASDCGEFDTNGYCKFDMTHISLNIFFR